MLITLFWVWNQERQKVALNLFRVLYQVNNLSLYCELSPLYFVLRYKSLVLCIL